MDPTEVTLKNVESRYSSMVGFCVHGNEPSGSAKRGELRK
jgi:hypothetical protein